MLKSSRPRLVGRLTADLDTARLRNLVRTEVLEFLRELGIDLRPNSLEKLRSKPDLRVIASEPKPQESDSKPAKWTDGA